MIALTDVFRRKPKLLASTATDDSPAVAQARENIAASESIVRGAEETERTAREAAKHRTEKRDKAAAHVSTLEERFDRDPSQKIASELAVAREELARDERQLQRDTKALEEATSALESVRQGLEANRAELELEELRARTELVDAARLERLAGYAATVVASQYGLLAAVAGIRTEIDAANAQFAEARKAGLSFGPIDCSGALASIIAAARAESTLAIEKEDILRGRVILSDQRAKPAKPMAQAVMLAGWLADLMARPSRITQPVEELLADMGRSRTFPEAMALGERRGKAKRDADVAAMREEQEQRATETPELPPGGRLHLHDGDRRYLADLVVQERTARGDDDPQRPVTEAEIWSMHLKQPAETFAMPDADQNRVIQIRNGGTVAGPSIPLPSQGRVVAEGSGSWEMTGVFPELPMNRGQ